jgi:hypothetical protein
MRHRDARWHDDPDVQKVLEANTRIIQAGSKSISDDSIPTAHDTDGLEAAIMRSSKEEVTKVAGAVISNRASAEHY